MSKTVIVVSILLLASCDCFITQQGTVIDEASKAPLADVDVYMVISKASLHDLAYQWDTLTIRQRDSINRGNPTLKREWKKGGWHYPLSTASRYVKNVPCVTDSTGNYDLYFFGGYCPRYSIRLSKAGYKDLVIPGDSLTRLSGDRASRVTLALTRQ